MALNILHLAGIPFETSGAGRRFAVRRCLKSEPLTDFFDAFVLGDGEEAILEVCREIIASRESRESRINSSKGFPAWKECMFPSFFHVTYQTDGTIERIFPLEKHSPSVCRECSRT